MKIILIFSILLISSLAQAKPIKIALLGDSIIANAGIEIRMRELMPQAIIDNYGVPCNTPWDIKSRISIGHGNLKNKILDPSEYSMVIVLAGYNGIWRGSANNIRGLAAVYAKLKQSKTKVMALTQPPWGTHKDWNPKLQRYISELNTWILSHPVNVDCVYDTTHVLMDYNSSINRLSLNPLYTRDGLHLNKEGGKALAEAFPL